MHGFSKILVCLLLLGCIFCHRESQKKSGTLMDIKYPVHQVKNGKVVINYHRCGDGDTTLLFVHGWCINQSYWSKQFEFFCNRYALVSFDLPGFGNSGKNRNDWNIENYAQDVTALIDQLELKNVILVGHSMGGDVILEAGLQNKEVIALIGVDNFKDVGITIDEQSQKEIDGFLKALNYDFYNTILGYVDRFLFLPSSDSMAKKRVMDDFSRADSTIAIATLATLFDYSVKERKQLSRLEQKLYLINSDATPTNIAGLEETGVAFEIIDIPATGHYPMIEKPDLFNQLLESAVEKISNHSK